MTDETAIDRFRQAGAEVHIVDMRRTPWAPTNLAAFREVRRLLRVIQPDVVHTHSSIGGLLGRLAVPKGGPPAVYTTHGITRVWIGLTIERLLRRRTAMFVALSPSERDGAIAKRVADPERVVVIPNGIDIDPPPPPVDLRAVYPIPADAPIVGTISRLVWEKAPEVLVEAFAVVAARRPDAHFVWIGGGELEDLYQASVDAHGLRARITRIEALPNADGVLGQFDVFVLASRSEAGPYAPLEAMRLGTPVVLPDVVGCRDTVVDDVSGRLVAPGDPQALGTAMADLLDDPDTRARLGRAGRARVAEHFDVRQMAASLEAMYTQLAHR